MSEKSILNLLSSVAILQRRSGRLEQSGQKSCRLDSAGQKTADGDSRSAVVVDPVDLSTDEDPDPAVSPFAPVGQQVGDQQSQTCRKTQENRFVFTLTGFPLFFSDSWY